MALYHGVAHGDTTPHHLTLDTRTGRAAAAARGEGATALRAAAALKRPTSSVRIRARKLGLSLPGVREVRKKLGFSPRGRNDIAPYSR